MKLCDKTILGNQIIINVWQIVLSRRKRTKYKQINLFMSEVLKQNLCFQSILLRGLLSLRTRGCKVILQLKACSKKVCFKDLIQSENMN